MFETALRFPREGDGTAAKIAIGGVLTVLGVLVLPGILAVGYVVTVVERVASGDDDAPPRFGKWHALLADGLGFVGILFVYSLPPLFAFALATLSLIVPVGVVMRGGFGLVLGVLAVLLALVVLLLASAVTMAYFYLAPAGVAAFALTGRLEPAFSPATIRHIGRDDGYAAGWLVAVGVVSVGYVLAGVLALAVGLVVNAVLGGIPGIVAGFVVAAFVVFYVNVGAAYAIGHGVRGVSLPASDDGPISGGLQTGDTE